MDWRAINKVTIFNEKDKNGNRYLSQFLSDYKKTFNPDIINAGCQRCLEDYYTKFINHLNMSKKDKKTAYKLKEKYNGIPLSFGSPILVTNANITDAYGDKLIKTHKRGADLFEEVPGQKDLESLKRADLNQIAKTLGLDESEFKTKQDLIVAIETKQEEIENLETKI